ncbi:DMT family transporter [Thalassobacillus hwangdonensis]|uniref:DMT family transporter n=1 Tax=Thalassobacillus hwangdonensis TaxID=546108 RepID=A0ABW3KYJ4_9BACI
MKGILFSITAGLCITLQGIFNSKMSDHISGWHISSIVHLVGFILCLSIYFFVRDGNKAGMKQVPPIYFFGGAFGVIVVFSELTAINMMGPASAIAILLVAQLIAAFLIEARGWFGEKKLKITGNQWVGIAMIVSGVVIFKL